MLGNCRLCGKRKVHGDGHHLTHSHYERAFVIPVARTPKDSLDYFILANSPTLSYRKIGNLFGVSYQRVGQRAKRLGISIAPNKVPGVYRKVN